MNDLLHAWAGGSGNLNDALAAAYGGSGSLNERERAFHGGGTGDNLNDALVAAMGAGNLQDNLAAYYALPLSGVLLSDTFDGAVASIDGRTPDTGPAWTLHAGTAATDGAGNLVCASDAVATAECDEADVTATMVAGESGEMRVVVRLTDASNYWYVQYETSGERLKIFEVVAGVPTERGSAVRSALDADRTLVVAVSGATIGATLEATATLEFSPMATGLAATQHGVGGTGTTAIRSIQIE